MTSEHHDQDVDEAPTRADLDELGPIDYMIFEFPHQIAGTGLPLLFDLIDRGVIRVIDLLFIRKSPDGSVTVVDLKESGGPDFGSIADASSGLLTEEDVAEAGGALRAGSAAAVLVYENLWAAPLAVALRKGGAQLVAGGRIPVQALLGALDEAERRDREAGATVPDDRVPAGARGLGGE